MSISICSYVPRVVHVDMTAFMSKVIPDRWSFAWKNMQYRVRKAKQYI